MIRIQMGCLSCGQMLDGTFAARMIDRIVVGFNEAHLYPKCQEEPLDGGQDEGKPDREVDGQADATAEAGGGKASSKAH